MDSGNALAQIGAIAVLLNSNVTKETALGDDAYSDRMLAQWRDEGVGTGLVQLIGGQRGMRNEIVDQTVAMVDGWLERNRKKAA